MQFHSSQVTSGQLRLQQTFCSIAEKWCPFNENLAQEVYQELNLGAHQEDRSGLVHRVSMDLGLFGFFIKELAKRGFHGQQRRHQNDSISSQNPTSVLITAPLADLKEVAKLAALVQPTHALSAASTVQLALLQRMLVSVSAAKLMAQPFAVDASLAQNCALFRQLGLFLVAWNYPHIFEKALAGADPTQSVGSRINKMLGFSPTLLAVTLAKEWRLDQRFISALSSETKTDSLPQGDTAPSTGDNIETLRHLCRVGEALANASDPEYVQDAGASWESARAEFEALVGPRALILLGEQVSQSAKNYLSACPNEIVLAKNLHSSIQALEQNSVALLNGNHYVRKCPQQTQILFTNFYADLTPNLISKHKIDYLTEHLSPALGFTSICIFLVDGESQTLIPRLSAGQRKRTTYKDISYLPSELNPIAQSYRSDAPLTGPVQGQPKLSFIAAPLGEKQRMGVIYIELNNSVLQDRSANPLTYFRALKQAFGDCLNLG